MTDDWTWGEGHDHSGYDGPDDNGRGFDDGGFDADDTDPFGVDLSGGGSLGGDELAGGHDAVSGGHDAVSGGDGSPDWDGALHSEDPFAPDALVAEHHDWAVGLDDGVSAEGPGPEGSEPVDATDLFGTDPDVSAYTDALWPTPEFPAALDLGSVLPEPIDGPPWTDPAALGAAPGPGAGALLPVEAPEPADLAAYAAVDPASSGWETLLGSDDPATSALARFWSPPRA